MSWADKSLENLPFPTQQMVEMIGVSSATESHNSEQTRKV